jgi:hypothetical protein
VDTSIVRGMFELLRGRIPEARQAFDLALRKEGKSRRAQVEHLSTFPGVLHALLLIQSDQPQDCRQARVWVDWLAKERGYTPYYSAYRLLDALLAFHEGREPDSGDDVWWFLRSPGMPLAHVAAFLAYLLSRLYASQRRMARAERRTNS